MRTCPGCQRSSPENAKFCASCGTNLPPPASRVVFDTGAKIDVGWGCAVVGKVLGDGGMGTVFQGWLYYNPNGPYAGVRPHPIAVKVLHPMYRSKPQVRALFAGEAQALSLLSHPNIVHFYGMAESEGQLALILELVEGESLDHILDRHVERAPPGAAMPALPFLRAWHYFQQLLGALAATHALGIVHRDVKPGNLLVRADGFSKLTDYGIARLPSEDQKNSAGMQAGTGAYMSPEQVLGKPLDGRSDLYSAAIVLYEMLSGRTPFEAPYRTEIHIRAAQVDETPAPLSDFVPQTPGVVDAIFAKALAKAPEDRFQNAIEFGDVFRRSLAIPDTAGWQAQQALARQAQGIVGKGGTMPIPKVDADRIRSAVAGAFRYEQPQS
jgi:eukaryotic-like serine/threonine-protein kinase